MTTGYRKARKELAAKMGDEATPIGRDALDSGEKRIFCVADGCPCRASVYFGSALCSWHDKAERHDWPRVSQELRDIIASGQKPARPTIKPAAWVVQAAAEVRAHLAQKGSAPNAFDSLAERLKARLGRARPGRGRSRPERLSDDEVNALLDEVRQ